MPSPKLTIRSIFRMIGTERLGTSGSDIARAAAHLRDGQCVAFPTETVYGLGADARNPGAAARIYEAKGRPRFNPLIVHVASLEAARRLGVFDDTAERLACAFWPGALSLVVPRRAGGPVADLTTAGLDHIALRVPAHAVAQALLAAAGMPIAAPSANPSGRVSPTTADHVLEGLEGRIAAVIDGGPAEVGLESTIVGQGAGPVLLRPGGVAAEEIERVLGHPLQRPVRQDDGTAPQSPGRLASHYAPGAALRLNADAPREGEAWLGFGPLPATAGPARSLSEGADLREAAARLFGHLRALDAAMDGAGTIAVAPIPDRGLGLAINDRLARAAAPR